MYDFKLQLESDDCQCSDLSHSPSGRIFNGTNLDKRDALYVAALYAANLKKIVGQLLLKNIYFLIFYH